MLVEVLNGTGRPHQAAEVAAALQGAGFGVDGTGNAASFRHGVTIIAYPAGGAEAAHTLAARLAGACELQLDDEVPPGVLDLVVGASWDGLRA